MKKFRKIETGIDGLCIIEPTVIGDNRGFFLESYNKKEFKELGLEEEFVQDNHSKSKKGVLRGLHFQTKHSQGKLVRVIKGSVYDIAVDIRKDSCTYGKWYGVELSEENKKMFYIPKGFAHGFLTLENDTEFQYKCTDKYAPEYDSGIMWNDRDLNIDWNFNRYSINVDDLILSEKDRKHQSFKEYTDNYHGEYVLIIGSNGQLGKEFIKLFENNGIKYKGVSHNEFDITNFEYVKRYILDDEYTVIINCAAYNDVDGAEYDCKKCYDTNSCAVKNLSEICHEKDIIFMTFSTDFVFDGEKEYPYTEEDNVNPLSVYAASKREGENFALKYDKSFVIRTSWLFGMGNNNFCKQVIEWSKNKDIIKVVDDQISSPTYTTDLAKAAWELINIEAFGLYHFSNEGEASKYDQAKYILDRIGWKGKLLRAKTKDFNLLANRPIYSKLDSYKVEYILNKKIPHWKCGIDRFLDEMNL